MLCSWSDVKIKENFVLLQYICKAKEQYKIQFIDWNISKIWYNFIIEV